jgi:hypothetical protein
MIAESGRGCWNWRRRQEKKGWACSFDPFRTATYPFFLFLQETPAHGTIRTPPIVISPHVRILQYFHILWTVPYQPNLLSPHRAIGLRRICNFLGQCHFRFFPYCCKVNPYSLWKLKFFVILSFFKFVLFYFLSVTFFSPCFSLPLSSSTSPSINLFVNFYVFYIL